MTRVLARERASWRGAHSHHLRCPRAHGALTPSRCLPQDQIRMLAELKASTPFSGGSAAPGEAAGGGDVRMTASFVDGTLDSSSPPASPGAQQQQAESSAHSEGASSTRQRQPIPTGFVVLSRPASSASRTSSSSSTAFESDSAPDATDGAVGLDEEQLLLKRAFELHQRWKLEPRKSLGGLEELDEDDDEQEVAHVQNSALKVTSVWRKVLRTHAHARTHKSTRKLGENQDT